MAQFVFSEWLVKFIAKKNFQFEWDTGNRVKSFYKHGIDYLEAEDAFNDAALIELGIQISPIVNEDRFGIIAQTNKGKLLFVAFTIRGRKIRIISARHANSKERELYEG